jgi:tripartite-type tricarboxylate transporter receptor subunit TctC
VEDNAGKPAVPETAHDRWISTAWSGLLAPIRTQPEVPARMNEVFNDAIRDATFQARVSEIAMMAVAATSTSTS